VARRVQVTVSLIGVSYICGFLAVVGHLAFWRSHGALANVVVGGLAVWGVLQIGVAVWTSRGPLDAAYQHGSRPGISA
jgi:hypothetical protein